MTSAGEVRQARRSPAESEVPRDRQRAPVTAVIIQGVFLGGAEINSTFNTDIKIEVYNHATVLFE